MAWGTGSGSRSTRIRGCPSDPMTSWGQATRSRSSRASTLLAVSGSGSRTSSSSPMAAARSSARCPRSSRSSSSAGAWATATGSDYTGPRMISTNQFRNGTHIDVDGTIYKIVEFQHVKPGKGGAFVRTKLRRASDGNVIDRTFRAGEKFRPVRTETRRMQYLYQDGDDAHCMDSETYDQLTIPVKTPAEPLRRMKAASEFELLYI